MASQDQQESDVQVLLEDVASSSKQILQTLEQLTGTITEDESADEHGAVEDGPHDNEAGLEPVHESICSGNHDEDVKTTNGLESRSTDLKSETNDHEQAGKNSERMEEIQQHGSSYDVSRQSQSQSLDFVLYGSKLRRKVVEIQNDNRMWEKFDTDGTWLLDEETLQLVGVVRPWAGKGEEKGQTGCSNWKSFRATDSQQPEVPEDQSLMMKMYADDYWVSYANEEIKRVRNKIDLKETGLDTVICLDTSASMEGEGWKQALQFLNQFLDGIMSHTTLKDEVYENIALVTFGKENCVQLYLTCDLIGVKQKLNKLSLGGNSPLHVGLLLTQAVLQGSGSILMYMNLRLPPRVFLVTDGNFTTALTEGPDTCENPVNYHMEYMSVLTRIATIKKDSKAKFYTVPVGSSNFAVLQEIAKLTDGSMVQLDDVEKHFKFFKNFRHAGRIDIELAKQPWLLRVPGAGDDLLSMLSDADREQVKDFFTNYRKADGGENSDSDEEEIYNSLPFGCRVQKNEPHPGNQTLVGTVTKHMADDNVGVTWDRKPLIADGLHEKVKMDMVHKVDIPRRLHGQLIEVGCRVKRGPDWRYSEQDGGAGLLGYVYKINPNGVVNVRWDVGRRSTYRFGCSGCFDLEIISHGDPVTEDTDTTGGEAISPTADNPHNSDIGTIEAEMNKKNTQDVQKEQSAIEHLNQMNLRNAQKVEGNKNKIAENSDRMSFATAASKSNTVRESVKQSVDEQLSALPGPHPAKSESMPSAGWDTGAKPKVKPSETEANTVVQWQWQSGDRMCSYPENINNKIEEVYQTYSAGSVVIVLDQQQYRIIFKRMEQVNIMTKEKIKIVRNSST